METAPLCHGVGGKGAIHAGCSESAQQGLGARATTGVVQRGAAVALSGAAARIG